MVELTGCGPVLTVEGDVNGDAVPSGSNCLHCPRGVCNWSPAVLNSSAGFLIQNIWEQQNVCDKDTAVQIN